MFAFLQKYLLILLLLAAGGYYWYVQTPCHLPIEYSAGSIDPGFKLSEAQLLDAADKAATVWEKVAGVNLFEYKKDGPLSINLVYDSRQATTQKNNQLKDAIDATSDTAGSVKTTYDAAQTGYKKAQAVYLAAQVDYQQSLAAYNAKVEYWNARGGAPKADYAAFQSQKAAVEEQYQALEQQRTALNAQAAEVNALGARYNQLVNNVNANVDAVNKSAGREFEEGLYTQNVLGAKIDIFEYSDQDKLVRVLSHEMGHALGLGHNQNPESIMYEQNQSANMAPTVEDISALKSVCGL